MGNRVIGKKCRELNFTSCDVVVDTSFDECDKCKGPLDLVTEPEPKRLGWWNLGIGIAACVIITAAVLIVSSKSAATRPGATNNNAAGAEPSGDADKKAVGEFLREAYRDGLKDSEDQAKLAELIRAHPVDARWLSQEEEEARSRAAKASALMKMGLLHGAEGRYAEAAEHLRLSLEIDERNSMAWANLAAACIKLNNLTRAQSACERAIDLNSRNWLAHYNLGAIHAAKGDRGPALFELSETLRLVEQDHSGQIKKEQIAGQIRSDESFDTLRTDERFRQLIAGNR